MFCAGTDSRFIVSNGRKSSVAPTQGTVLDILDRFAQVLQKGEPTAMQIRVALETVYDSIDADVVYWYPGQAKERMALVGRTDLSLEWCLGLATRLLAETPGVDSQLLRSSLDYKPANSSPPPQSVAMVRISKSKGSWIVALSFRPVRHFQLADKKAMSLARRLLLIHRQNALTQEKLTETLFGVVGCLTAAIDTRHPYTCGHSERVARIAVRLGQQMRLPDPTVSDLYLAGLLHDIGKIGIGDAVLRKLGPLTQEEFAHMQAHTVIGDRLLSNITPLQHLRPAVRNHHEQYGGGGYPDGLRGEDIPWLARIIAVADACDAMMSDRDYRPALPTARIDRIMSEGAGAQWDPAIIGHFLACRHELYSICQRGLGESMFAAVEKALTNQDDASSLPRAAGRG